jgi:hypothetical protein
VKHNQTGYASALFALDASGGIHGIE